MSRAHRALPLLLVALAAIGACRRKPEPAPPPAAAPVETCNQACRDSIANANRIRDSIANARADSIRRAEEARNASANARAALLAPIYFDLDLSDIRDDSRAKLEQKALLLNSNPSLRIRIAGHCDNRGSDEYNLALGQRRAAAAKRFLTDRGIDASRIEIVSFGEERPAAQGEDETSWSQNRRAEFEITAGGDMIVAPASR